MKTIQADLLVAPEGQMSLRSTEELEPGEYAVVIVAQRKPANKPNRKHLNLPPPHQVGAWSDSLGLGREELYD